MKKRGFGAGRWNGFGGKVEPGELLEDAARRELYEEAGIKTGSIERVGVINFEFFNDPVILEVNVFKTPDFTGEFVESEEMKPQWFDIKEIPFDQMWPDDKYWLPLCLEGKKFKGHFLFRGHDEIISSDLKEVTSI